MAQNLLILGAGGGLGKTLLACLEESGAYEEVVALDRTLDSLHKRWPRPKRGWHFVKFELGQEHKKELIELIRSRRISTVIDLTDAHTPYIADVIIRDGFASYVNTAFCVDDSAPPLERLKSWLAELPERVKKPHILFSGMNPGVINVLTAYAIREQGNPEEIIEFEFDSSAWIRHPDRHIITWSMSQFLTEMIIDPAEEMRAHGKITQELPNSMFHCEQLHDLLSPMITPRTPAFGCVTAHEECLTLSRRFHVPMKFIYSVHPRTMAYLREAAVRGDDTFDLTVGDNVHRKLSGSDNIGVALNYAKRRVTMFNSMSNKDVEGASATLYQVMVGVLAALSTLLNEKLEPKIYFPEDLLDTSYFSCITKNLDIRQFEKSFGKGGRMGEPARVSSPLNTIGCLSPEVLLTPEARKRILA